MGPGAGRHPGHGREAPQCTPHTAPRPPRVRFGRHLDLPSLVRGRVPRRTAPAVAQEGARTLDLLSRDFDRHDVLAAGFLVNAAKLMLATPDASGTLRQFEYVRT